MKNLTLSLKFLIVLSALFIACSGHSQNSWNTAAVYSGSNYFSKLDGNINGTSGEMTVEFWIKLNNSSGSHAVIGKNQFRIMIDGSKVRVQVNGSSSLYSIASIDSGKWTHVAVSISDVSNDEKVYLNGVLDNTYATYSGTFTATTDSLIIGKNSYVDNFEGELDEVRIWSTVRTYSEIQNNYKTHIGWYGSTYYDPNLVFCQTYDFDVYYPGVYFPNGDEHGVFSSDIIGNKPSNTVIHNNSMFFTGSSYLESGSPNDINVSLTGNATYEAWIYPTSIGTTQTILDLTEGGVGGFRLSIENSGKLSWLMNNIGSSNKVLVANNWYHIAIVCFTPSAGNQAVSIYINGVYDMGYNYNQMVSNTGKLRIGANHSTSNYFNGYIDEVRISNYSKTSEEIQRNLHTPILYLNQPETPKTTVAYNFDGNMYSGTRLGHILNNEGCRFSYYDETSSPLFHLGSTHELTLDSFKIKHPFIPIPETGTTGNTYDTLNINSNIILDENKIKVFLSLNHSYTSDLLVELISPDGDSIKLIDRVYRLSQGFTFILNNQSDDLSTGLFNDLSPIVRSSDLFSKFNGKNSNGVWKLKITDFGSGDVGILNSWGLLIDGAPYLNINSKQKNENAFTIFPNPTNNKYFTIQSNLLQSDNNKVQVLTLTGQSILEFTTKDSNSINVNLPEETPIGTYIVVVTNSSGKFHSKLILN